MPAALDLTTIGAATDAVVAAMQSSVCQWEQQSKDAACDGNLTAALMYQHWAFAADLMAKTAATTLTRLMVQGADPKTPEFTLRVLLEVDDLEPFPA